MQTEKYVTPTIPKAHQPIHCNVSVLFQFIVSSFLSVYTDTQELKKISARNDITELDNEWDSHLKKLIEKFSALSGPIRGHLRSAPWDISEGHLTKLRNYCHFYYLASHDHTALEMDELVNKAWVFCLEGMDILRIYKLLGLQKVRPMTVNLKPIKQKVTKLERLMKPIASILVDLFPTFKNDENVLFFLLRHQNELKLIYGSAKFREHLCKLHGGKVEELEDFLKKKYLDRGFDNLIPDITKQIKSLNKRAKRN